LSGTVPAAFSYSKKERTTESLKATVAALFLRERSQSLQRTTSCGRLFSRTGLQQQVERLTEAYLGSVPDLVEYERRRREIEGRAEAFASQERELGQQVGRRRELAGMVDGVEDYCRRVSEGLAGANFEQRRRPVELLIDRVIVTEEEVEIRYVIPTSRRGEHARFCHLRTNYLQSLPAIIS
jgi:site-specific DNA recombinase